jgi:hypothetical protein
VSEFSRKFDSINDKSSDTAPLDLRGALEGTIVDNPALSTDMIFRVIVPLVGIQVACPVCEKREIHLFFVTLSDLGRHLVQHHTEARINWECSYCQRSFPKLHGAKCHMPKCSGPSQRTEVAYKSEACPMSFGTQKGFSTPERHAHPAVRNIERRGTDLQDPSKWTEDEITLLKELWDVYKNHRHPNKIINEIPTSETVDQIKYQKRKLKLSNEDASHQEVTKETEGGCDPVDPGNACFALESMGLIIGNQCRNGDSR